MSDEQQLRIILGAISVVIIYAAIKAFRKRKDVPPEKPAEPSNRFYRFQSFGYKLGIACRNLFKKHASDK